MSYGRHCGNCRYYHVYGSQYPCNECLHNHCGKEDKWEVETENSETISEALEDSKDEEILDCNSCEYNVGNHNYWKPKENDPANLCKDLGFIEEEKETKEMPRKKKEENKKPISETSVAKDNINPDHYKSSTSLECIEAMTIMFGWESVVEFCKCNAWKYIWRWKNKNGHEDLNKANWYLKKAKDIICEQRNWKPEEHEWYYRIGNYILKHLES